MSIDIHSVFDRSDSEINMFLEFVNPPEKTKKSKVEAENRKVIKELEQFRQKIIKKAESHENIYTFKTDNYSACYLIWISRKLVKLQDKFNKCFKEYCKPYFDKIGVMIEHVKKFSENGFMCRVDVQKFEEYIDSRFLRNNITANKYYNKIVRLDKFANFNSSARKYPMIGENACKEQLKEVAKNTNSTYLPLGDFDDIFECFCRNNDSLNMAFEKAAEQFVDEIKGTFLGTRDNKNNSFVTFTKDDDDKSYKFADKENKIEGEVWNIPNVSFDFFDKLLSESKYWITPSRKHEEILLQNTVIRHFFYRVYDKYPYLTTPVKLDDLYHKAAKIKNMTLANILTDCDLERNISIKYKKQKFCDIAHDDNEFKITLAFLEESQFYISPLDINFYINEAIKNMNEILRNWLRGYQDQSVVESDKLIITLTAFLSVWPICDPIAFLCFQQFTSKLKMTNDFDVARTIFISSVGYLRDAELQCIN